MRLDRMCSQVQVLADDPHPLALNRRRHSEHLGYDVEIEVDDIVDVSKAVLPIEKAYVGAQATRREESR
jgi:hypothetical protein